MFWIIVYAVSMICCVFKRISNDLQYISIVVFMYIYIYVYMYIYIYVYMNFQYLKCSPKYSPLSQASKKQKNCSRKLFSLMIWIPVHVHWFSKHFEGFLYIWMIFSLSLYIYIYIYMYMFNDLLYNFIVFYILLLWIFNI